MTSTADRHRAVRVRVAGDLRVSLDELGPERLAALRSATAIENPAWDRARQRTGRVPFGVAREIELVAVEGADVVVPRGLGPVLAEVLGGALEIDDRTIEGERVDLELRRTLRAYQVPAVEALAARRLGIVAAPTGAGKTTIGLAAIARVGRRALVVAPTRDLVRQWVQAAHEVLGVVAGELGGARAEIPEAPIVIGTPQAALTHAPRLAASIGIVAVDEAHRAAAPTYRAVLRAIPSRRRWGVTATAERGDGLFALVEAELGGAAHTVHRAELEASGALLAPEIVQAATDYACRYTGPDDWAPLLEGLAGDAPRNARVVEIVEGEVAGGRSALVLVQRREHADALATALVVRGVRARPVHGGRPPREREAALAALRAGEIDAITATSIADEGLDLPGLGAVVLAAPARLRGRILQRIGRVVRPAPGKPRPRVVDVVDVRVGVLAAQARARVAVYRATWPGIVPSVLAAGGAR